MGTLSTLAREAIKGVGGIDYVLLANYADVSTGIYNTGDSSAGLAWINPVAANWTKFVPRKESSNFTETMTGTPTSGISSYNQVLTLVFAYNQTTKRNQLKIMGQSELVAVVVDRNDNAWLLGSRNGLDLTSGTLASGTANTDMNGMTIVLSGNESEPMGTVDASLLAELIAVL
jgi:hypothetical protein